MNLGKAGFQFANAALIPELMATLERGPLARRTPCRHGTDTAVAEALDEVHAELILHSAMGGDYEPLTYMFSRVIERSRRAASSRQ